MGCVGASSVAAPGEDRMAAPLNSQNMELCVLVVAVEMETGAGGGDLGLDAWAAVY